MTNEEYFKEMMDYPLVKAMVEELARIIRECERELKQCSLMETE